MLIKRPKQSPLATEVQYSSNKIVGFVFRGYQREDSLDKFTLSRNEDQEHKQSS